MSERKYSHYHKKCGYEYVDVYRVLKMFEVTDPCLQHIVKKALCAGNRGHKDYLTDLNEIKATVDRAIEMMMEDENE